MKQGMLQWIGLAAAALLIAPSAQAGSASRYDVASRLDLPVPAVVPRAIEPVQEPLDQRLIANLLVESIIQIESLGNPRMVGSKGERGLMQIMAATWSDVTRRHFGQRIGFDRAFDAQLNRQVGAAYLNDLQAFLTRHRALWKADERSLLLACYNAGPERVRQCGFDVRRLPASTRDYVQRGSALHEALLADHQISTRQVRLAMDATRRAGGV
ncbi:MAG TPA: lytic transglycosylase domain-containing protein [Kiritimatiellia bacterium]|nr:lytic transglycosylase domain-containing protein [Kiritimatiellia bacterium]